MSRPSIDAQLQVVRVEAHPLPYYSVILEAPPDWPPCDPGQFVMVGLSDRLEPYLRRAFSVFDVLEDGGGGAQIEILGKTIGRLTRLLPELQEGDLLSTMGPLGKGFHIVEEGRVALVAGGVGSAALLLLGRSLAQRGVVVDVFYGGRSALDHPCLDRFERIVSQSGGRLVVSTEDGTRGHEGLVTAPLEAALDRNSYRYVYTCGPEGLMRAVATLCQRRGIAGQAALETPMGCGFGACLGCAVPLTSGRFGLCCKDGPAFDFEEVVW